MLRFITSFLLTLILFQVHAQTENVGVATYFDGLGTPYGGCGVPQEKLETQDFVALNVFNTPGNGTQYTRPVPDDNIDVMGEFQNGYNCGRWMKVTIMENCKGTNDGALGQQFCRGASSAWISDKFVGAELNMIVADACGDANGWCRDSPYHLDIMKPSLSKFNKNGVLTTDMVPANWNNRKVKWEYIEAPNYTGDIKIHFMKDAQMYYSPILITNLKNGIHGIEQKIGSNWVAIERFADMGQAFILKDNKSPMRIRVIDVNDEYVNKAREYVFSLPASCNPKCVPATTQVTYQVFDVVTSLDNEKLNPNSLWVQSANRESAVFWSGLHLSDNVVKVQDVTGKELKSFSLSGENGTIDIGLLPQGIFTVLLYEKGFLAITKRLIVN